MLFADIPQKVITVKRQKRPLSMTNFAIDLEEAMEKVLLLPCVADKSFLINIADRSVGGMVAREPMVGPWQIPVADAGITLADYTSYKGEVIAIGERTPLATLNPVASGRMAIGELITNIASAPISGLNKIKLSANWMAAMDDDQDKIGLYDTLAAVAMDLCPDLGLCIPVGKDSLSMQVQWQEQDGQKTLNKKVKSPLSLIITGAAIVDDVRIASTPVMVLEEVGSEATDLEEKSPEETSLLMLIDLGQKQNRLGGSALMQVYQTSGTISPDLDDPQLIKRFFEAIQALRKQGYIQAYHDRSDGGLWVCLLEMAFASHCGLQIDLTAMAQSAQDLLNLLFNEELGAVIQIKQSDLNKVNSVLTKYALTDICHMVGKPQEAQITLVHQGAIISNKTRQHYQTLWSKTSFAMAARRDNGVCVQQAVQNLKEDNHPELYYRSTYQIKAPAITGKNQPRLALLREQGVNGHLEMAAAFTRAGFIVEDVHMSDLMAGHKNLDGYNGLALGGGFSYGDVFGAGQGWAKSILHHPQLAEMFHNFFARTNTFTLGICNGCQTLSYLSELMPDQPPWPQFISNASQQFESRLVMTEILPSSSIFLTGMEGSRLPVVVAHGEGRIMELKNDQAKFQACLTYIDNAAKHTELYPFNPNGSVSGITGLTSRDGRITMMMPHPERLFRRVLNTWESHRNLTENQEDGAWMQMFYNARKWV